MHIFTLCSHSVHSVNLYWKICNFEVLCLNIRYIHTKKKKERKDVIMGSFKMDKLFKIIEISRRLN
jgi:hypothetical protein